jgi:ABC-type transport system involved in cytochrome bd biosynthesis fused ATPase/permease subunit
MLALTPRSLNVQWLREHMAVVEQTTALFPGTIGENIAIAKENASLEEIVEAARLVGSLSPKTADDELTSDRAMHMASSRRFLMAMTH